MIKLEQILEQDAPYFGGVLHADQGTAHFEHFKKVIDVVFGQPPLTILEIGSWAGNSLNAWNEASDHTANFIVVDTWTPYFPEDNGAGSAMNRACRSGDIEKLFWHNMRAIEVIDRLKVHKGYSSLVLPTLAQDSVDIVFIDGNHLYQYVKQDILDSLKLLRKGGVICGDDLPRQSSEIRDKFKCKWAIEKNQQFIVDEDGLGYHPGVTVAVHEIFGHVQTFDRLWMVQK